MKRSLRNGNAPRIDIRGVASHAKVSIATVSRTINYVSTVDPALAARVWKAVAELNYFPNTQARALVSGKSKLLGLIVSEITNPFFPELIQEFEQVAVAHGYEILIGSTNYEPKTMELCARRMLERKVDGVAIMTFGVEEFLLDRFIARRHPHHLHGSASRQPHGSSLAVDYRAGINEGVQHLAVLGHRKIAFISGPLKPASAETRREAFLELHATRRHRRGPGLGHRRRPYSRRRARRHAEDPRAAPNGPPPSCAPTTSQRSASSTPSLRPTSKSPMTSR